MTPNKIDSYNPKKCTKISKKLQNLKGDGELWVERIVYDKKTGAARSFFQSVLSDDIVWDEPPTGASKIVLATQKHKYPFLAKYSDGIPPNIPGKVKK